MGYPILKVPFFSSMRFEFHEPDEGGLTRAAGGEAHQPSALESAPAARETLKEEKLRPKVTARPTMSPSSTGSPRSPCRRAGMALSLSLSLSFSFSLSLSLSIYLSIYLSLPPSESLSLSLPLCLCLCLCLSLPLSLSPLANSGGHA